MVLNFGRAKIEIARCSKIIKMISGECKYVNCLEIGDINPIKWFILSNNLHSLSKFTLCNTD